MKAPLITTLILVNHPQVYGHKSSVSYNAWEAEAQEAKARSLADRWSELSRKLRLDIEIQVRRIETLELNTFGIQYLMRIQLLNIFGIGSNFTIRDNTD